MPSKTGDYSRQNDSDYAWIWEEKVFASGAFKDVYQGWYIGGGRDGRRCVAKEFKTGSVFEESYFAEEMRVIERTQRIIDDCHKARFIDKRILLNRPEVWDRCHNGSKTLVEPMIDNFEKFNSNTGWVSPTGDVWSEAMQALSHFSYHNSGGRLLLCDLQGGCYSNGYVLSDPVIMSQTKLSYGPTDLGPEGICVFFSRHKCGLYCRKEWLMPKIQGLGPVKSPMQRGTAMAAYLPTRVSRKPLSRLTRLLE
ncbi:kinase-like domain-containing protein [Nemania sp. FL0916]|nr:kinase-like domain-containing protein [Nemania sp. FL0916]